MDWMAKHPHVRLLEVTVAAQKPALWKWHVSEADVELAHGYATTRETAQIAGDDALFTMLSIGAR
jgi:hypothetical protein